MCSVRRRCSDASASTAALRTAGIAIASPCTTASSTRPPPKCTTSSESGSATIGPAPASDAATTVRPTAFERAEDHRAGAAEDDHRTEHAQRSHQFAVQKLLHECRATDPAEGRRRRPAPGWCSRPSSRPRTTCPSASAQRGPGPCAAPRVSPETSRIAAWSPVSITISHGPNDVTTVRTPNCADPSAATRIGTTTKLATAASPCSNRPAPRVVCSAPSAPCGLALDNPGDRP